MQGEVTVPSTQIIVQPPATQSPQQQQQQQENPYFKYLRLQYWPAWSLILGLIGFFCILGGAQSIVDDCDDSIDGCSILQAYIFWLIYLPNILVVLVGVGIAVAAHYQQTGNVIKCCLPCAMVALFIWAAIVCWLLGLLYSSLVLFCEESYYDTSDFTEKNYSDTYTCTDLKPTVQTMYAGQVILLIYLILVTIFGCAYGCKGGQQAAQQRANGNGAPLVVVQTSAAVMQPMQPMYQTQPMYQQPYVQQQGYVQQQPYVQQGYTQQPYGQQSFGGAPVYPEQQNTTK